MHTFIEHIAGFGPPSRQSLRQCLFNEVPRAEIDVGLVVNIIGSHPRTWKGAFLWLAEGIGVVASNMDFACEGINRILVGNTSQPIEICWLRISKCNAVLVYLF